MLMTTNLVYRIREAIRSNDHELANRLFLELDDALSNDAIYPTQWITDANQHKDANNVSKYAVCGHKLLKNGKCTSLTCSNTYLSNNALSK